MPDIVGNTQANVILPSKIQQIQEVFPDQQGRVRLQSYEFYEQLFEGDHFSAFAMQVKDERYTKEYSKLRYVTANYAGLISKVVADLLFIEPPKIKAVDGDQLFIDGLVSENKLRMQFYESALSNSYFGDMVFKARVGQRDPNDEESTIIIEQVTPKIYFPVLDPYNILGEPKAHVLAWVIQQDGKRYLRKEIHTPGQIENELYLLESDRVGDRQAFSIIGLDDLPDVQDTKINRSLVIHIPNWRSGNSYFGKSDYYDLPSLFYAINNRLTKVDNILDKHSDPILAIPDGIVDEQGKVKRENLNLFIRPQDTNQQNDPAYITWDANLQTAMDEIDKLVEITFMMSEIAPDVLGMGKGQADSGRALKFKLLRTLAKTQRKQIYYREGIIELLYVAQLLAQAWSIKVEDKTLASDPVKPQIEWEDGLPNDQTEQVAIEVQRVDAGLTTKVDSIMRLDDIDKDEAEEKVKEINAETAIAIPSSNLNPKANGFANGKSGSAGTQDSNKADQNMSDMMKTNDPMKQ